MAAMDTIAIIVLVLAAAVFIYNKFGEPIGRFWEWMKGLMAGNQDRFKPRASYAKELIYE